MAETSDQSAATTLQVVAGALGGLACVLLLLVLVRAYHWHRLKSKRRRQQQDVVERFSIEFLSQRLDASMTSSTGRRTYSQASHSQPAQQPCRLQYPQSISEDFERRRESDASNSAYINTSMDYENAAIELSQRISVQPSARNGLHGIGEMVRSGSMSSMEANPNYTPTMLDTSSNSGSGVESLPGQAMSPTVEISSSAMQRPYALLGGGATNSLAPQVHYQQAVAGAPDATAKGRRSPQVEAVRRGPRYSPSSGRNPNGNRRHSPAGVRSASRSSSNDVFVDGVYQNGRRPSPQLMPPEHRPKTMSTTSSFVASEMDEEYTSMSRKTSSVASDVFRQNGRRPSPQLMPNDPRPKTMSTTSSFVASEMDEEYTSMSRKTSSVASDVFRQNGRRPSPQPIPSDLRLKSMSLASSSAAPSEVDEEYTPMTSSRCKSTASAASGSSASQTLSPRYQNVAELASTNESGV